MLETSIYSTFVSYSVKAMCTKLFSFLSLFLIVMLFSGCSEYQKLINGDVISDKYKAAEAYYKEGDYRKANRLFEMVIPSYRGKPQAERLIFFFADSYYYTKDYYLAAYQFENFIKSYPKSNRIVQAYFMAAKSYYMKSPIHSLDQKDTHTAVEKLQIFINNYPNSEFTEEANALIIELQTKLEQKDFEISKQYYTIQDYKAAIQALDNFVGEFPGTKFREEALYYKFLASFEIASNSVAGLQEQRLLDLKKLHSTILKYYPETIFSEDLAQKLKRVDKLLATYQTEEEKLTK